MKFTKRKVFSLGGKYSEEYKNIRNNVTIQINDKIYKRGQLKKRILMAIIITLSGITIGIFYSNFNDFFISVGLSPFTMYLWFILFLSLLLSGFFLLLYYSNAENLLRYQVIWECGQQNVQIYENQGEKSFQKENQEEKKLLNQPVKK